MNPATAGHLEEVKATLRPDRRRSEPDENPVR